MTDSQFSKAGFMGAMARYSKLQPRWAPDFSEPFVLDFWFDQLKVYPAEVLGRAMATLCSKDKFPSIEEVRRECGDEPVSDETVARDTADRIWQAICKYGSSSWERVSEYIGEVGQRVVGGPGGYKNICDTVTYANASTFKAQWREAAKGQLEMARKGATGPAKLPPVNENVARLIDNACKNVKTLGPACKESSSETKAND